LDGVVDTVSNDELLRLSLPARHHRAVDRHTLVATDMEEGAKNKKTIFIGGIGEDVDEEVILEAFSTFGASC
jgi:RNA recognition motif-containing protein